MEFLAVEGEAFPVDCRRAMLTERPVNTAV